MNGSIRSIFSIIRRNYCNAFSKIDLCELLTVLVCRAFVIHWYMGCFSDKVCICVMALSAFFCRHNHRGSSLDSISSTVMRVVQQQSVMVLMACLCTVVSFLFWKLVALCLSLLRRCQMHAIVCVYRNCCQEQSWDVLVLSSSVTFGNVTQC